MNETEQTVNQMSPIVPKQLTVSKLSRLQKAILKEGLKCVLELPLQRANSPWRRGQIRVEDVLKGYFGLRWQDRSLKIAAARVSICRALASLCKRGLFSRIVEPGSVAQYRITPDGESLARSIHPDLLPQLCANTGRVQKRLGARRRRDLRSGVTFEQFVQHCETGEPLPELPPAPKPLNISQLLALGKLKNTEHARVVISVLSRENRLTAKNIAEVVKGLNEGSLIVTPLQEAAQ